MTGLLPMKRTRDVPPQSAMMPHSLSVLYLLEVFSRSYVPRLPGGDPDSRPRQFMDSVSSAECTSSLLPVTLRLLGNLIAADHFGTF